MSRLSLTKGIISLLHILSLLLAPSHATPVGGPLGSTPGGPQGPIPQGSGDAEDPSAASDPGDVAIMRAICTFFAIFVALLVTVTYAVLIGPGTRLSSTSKVPLRSIKRNIENLLGRAWPDGSGSGSAEWRSQSARTTDDAVQKEESDAIRLFYVGKMNDDIDHEKREARGTTQCTSTPNRRVGTPAMWLTTGSTLTRCMVQLAVWEWVSLWMVLAMAVSTLMFNGFLTGEKKPDSYPRLVVVGIYFLAFSGHAWYVWRMCGSFFSLLGAGATWSMLHKASFASVELGMLRVSVDGNTSPIFRQVGKPAASPTFPPFKGCRLRGANQEKDEAADEVQPKNEDLGAINTIGDWQRREISTTVLASEIALERVMTNVMAMVGISITTGFAAWTSMAQATDSTTQLGSLALLASLTIGTGAMFSSAVELSVMDTSFRNVLFFKELLINGQAAEHVQKRARKKNIVGFTHGTLRAEAVKFMDLARSTRAWNVLLFGPAFTLLPSAEDHSRQSAGAEFDMGLDVRGRQVLFTTEITDGHRVDADGANVEAINVCFNPEVELRRGSTEATCRSYPKEAQLTMKEV